MITPHRHISPSVSMPVIGLGTWKLTGRDAIMTVQQALDVGYRHIDTADIYDNHHEIGEAIQCVPREDLFITTKVWRADLGANDLLDAVERFLEELNITYIDLLLIHWPNKEISLHETLSTMKELYDIGVIRSIGVANFTISHLQEALSYGISIAVNQVEYHPELNQEDLRLYCSLHGIQVVAYSPLKHGELIKNEVIRAVAEEIGCTPSQCCLAWLLQKGIIVIPKASSTGHLQENLASSSISLSKSQMLRIDAIENRSRYINPVFAEFEQAVA